MTAWVEINGDVSRKEKNYVVTVHVTLKLIISLKGKVQYMWRRELKCIKAAKKQLVTVHVTAWVEIKDIRSRNPVTVHVTAWVERLAPYAESQYVVVTVHVTAWVEMEWLNSYLRHQSHSTCDSVSWKKYGIVVDWPKMYPVTVHVTAWVEIM